MSASINHEEYLRRWIQSADVWVGLMVWVSFWLVASLNRKFGINHLIGNGGGLVVSVVLFYSENQCSYPDEVSSFLCKN